MAPFYSHTGRPSIDPELMIRMLVIGYCFGIRSERRLCDEAHLNLAYRWFCRLDLEQRVPDHSTFSKNRHGRLRESDAFRHLFETVLRRCMKIVKEKKIEPHIPVWEKANRDDGTFSRSDTFDAGRTPTPVRAARS